VSYFGGGIPQAVQEIARQYGVDPRTALAILMMMQQSGRAPTPMQAGGQFDAGQSILVGENGPEIITPSIPGSIAPTRPPLMRPIQPQPEEGYGPQVRINPERWDAWLKSLPQRWEHIEDRRQEHSPEELLRIMGYRKEWK
jgi:hypothetical protein